MNSKPLTDKDFEKIELYMKSGATQVKISQAMGLTEDSLRKKVQEHYQCGYTELAQKLRTTGELLIEAKQFQEAMNGNIKMLIWLGKVRCGQRENDVQSTIPAIQDDINKDHLIMELNYKVDTLTKQIGQYGNQSKAESELCGSHSQV